ncbi:MAG TPA: cysteine--tRNA ligase, partial [Thermodesulfobacteriota bacterium]|nr:cysteine--tRNA ligase [Thermodesulfobacteriota bacterium]
EVIGNIFKEVGKANRLMDEAKASGKHEGLIDLSYILSMFHEASEFLGIFGRTPEEYFSDKNSRSSVPAQEIEKLIAERNEARKKKDFKRADEIRQGLLEKGIVLEDGARGTTWSVKN